MQMHESKANTSRSGNTSSQQKNNKSNNQSNNQISNTANSDSNSNIGRKNKVRNSNRDKNSDNDAKSASVMSNLSSYSLIDDDHIDDQESINVGNLIIDLESDLEKEKIEIEQANNNNIDSNVKLPNICSTSTSNAPSSLSSSSIPSRNVGNNEGNSKASSSSTTITESKPGGKNNQKLANKHLNSSSNNDSINSINNNGHTSTRTVFKSSADERGELKMKITRETKPAKNDHRIVASPNQKSPTSSSNTNTASNNHSAYFEDTSNDAAITKPSQSSSISSTKECGTSTSVGTITEPECLGPCEPGTSVTLEGIVWQETEGGILVVNVTWRGKTYVGALLDCTRHDWAPPRLCDSPASGIDSKTNKNVRTKRIVTRSNGTGLDEKDLLQTTGKLRNGKGRRILSSNDPASSSKKPKESSDKPTNENSMNDSIEANAPLTAGLSAPTISENTCPSNDTDTTQLSQTLPGQQDSITTSAISTEKSAPSTPTLIGCTEPNCSKKYRNRNGLMYHKAHAHSSDTDRASNNALEDACASSSKDKQPKKTTNKQPSTEPKDDQMDTGDQEDTTTTQDDQKFAQIEQHATGQKRERSLSPQLPSKMTQRMSIDRSSPLNHKEDNRTNVDSSPTKPSSFNKSSELERRNVTNPSAGNALRGEEFGRRSPEMPPSQRHPNEMHGQGSSSMNQHQHASLSKPSSSVSKQSNNNQPPLPATTEEGMKPSGTSTGPPPAPHQANCYFNSAFLANTFNPYGLPPYFPRSIYDPIAPPTPTSNAAFLSRFMNNMRVPPPPDSPSRLLSPSMPKNLPFPPFKVEPGAIPPPHPPPPPPQVSTSLPGPMLPNLGPLPPLGGPAPPLRMPSQGDPCLPPTSQPPFLPPISGLNPALGLPGAPNSMLPGGPHMPSLVDDQLAKQFPRRFN